MNAEDLLIIGALGAAVYYVMHQSTTAAAASASPASTAVSPMAASINVQPSTIPLSNPISSLAPSPAPVPQLAPSPAPAPPIPTMAIPPPPTGQTYTAPPSVGPVQPPDYIPLQLSVHSDPVVALYPTPGPTGPVAPAQTVQPGIVPTSSAPVSSITVAPPVATYNPVLSYSFSRPGSTLNPGDTWTVNISGAKPGATVSMLLTQNGGFSANNILGYINSAGTFSYTGTANTGSDGQWLQAWYVDSTNVGKVSFTVFDQVVNAVMPTALYNGGIPNNPAGTPLAPTQGNQIYGGVVYQTGTLWI